MQIVIRLPTPAVALSCRPHRKVVQHSSHRNADTSDFSSMRNVLGLDSAEEALLIARKHPRLLDLPQEVLARRVIQLAVALPDSNVAAIIKLKPSLLLVEDIPAIVGRAKHELEALMPGIPIESKLHQGGTVWWSFASLLPNIPTR